MKFRILLVLIIYMVVIFSESLAQNVGIGDGAEFTPDPSSILELKSTSKGFLMPRVTRAERILIANPAHGLMVIQTDDFSGAEPAGIWYYCNVPTVCNEWRNIVNMSNNVTFANILTGTNTQATMEVGTGATLSTTGNGTIQANIFANSNSVTTSVDLQTSEVAGILPVLNGGTGTSSSPTANSIIVGNTTGDGYTSTTGNEGQVLSYDNLGNLVWITPATGTVTSVGIDLPTTVFANGADVTTTGDLTATFIDQAANTVFAGPSTGVDATPTFRALVAGDISSVNASSLVGTVAVTNGGTGLNAAPAPGSILYSDGTDYLATAGTNGQVLTVTGGIPTWSNPTMPSLSEGSIWLGGAGDVATEVTIGGDISLANDGNVTITGLDGFPIGIGPALDNQVLVYDSGSNEWVYTTLNNGSVTSVGLVLPTNEFDITVSPITTSGDLTATWKSQNQNLVFASPNGGAGTPIFRKIESGDISSIDASTITSGVLGINYGGTGLNAAPAPGSILYSDGTDYLATAAPTTTGQVLAWNNTTSQWEPTSPTSGGTVTSVGIDLPTTVFLNGADVTTSGDLTATFINQAANTVFAGPTAAPDATPAFRALVSDDIPNLDASKITTGSFDATRIPSLDASKITTGTLSTNVGGTGTSVAPTANGVIISNAAGNGYTSTAEGTTGQVLIGNTGGAPTWSNLNSVAWGLTGNPSTNPATNFVGTTDAQPLVFRTNSTEKMRIGTNGNIGIDETTPSQKLSVKGNILIEPNGATASQLRFATPNDTSKYTAFLAQTQKRNQIQYTLPDTMGVQNSVLSTDSTGKLFWQSMKDVSANLRGVVTTIVSSNYNAQATDDHIICDNSTNDISIILPTPNASLSGKKFFIKAMVQGNKVVCIDPGPGFLFDGYKRYLQLKASAGSAGSVMIVLGPGLGGATWTWYIQAVYGGTTMQDNCP